ncbi:MAG: hypothetical protein HY518_05095 [Candidatus Aenigmarchaeota archaeon]|nr:hypothetical protein [Candidatus Aenigmarchaeota archaeon]
MDGHIAVSRAICSTLLALQSDEGSVVDPVTKIPDQRATAEVAKSLLFTGKSREGIKSFRWLLEVQNKNGSFNETFSGFNEESCVATGIVGRLMLVAYRKAGDRKLLESALRAGEYVLSKEFSPGYFIKSPYHYGDILNVNATCAALLYQLHLDTGKQKYLDARNRAIYNTVRYQFKDGAYPYAAPARTFPYEYELNVKDPHYHSITLYFLLAADPDMENPYARISVAKAAEWLSSTMTRKGFSWRRCRLPFSIGATGGYGYAAYCFRRLGRIKDFENTMQKLGSMEKYQGLFGRYEPFSFPEMVGNVIDEVLYPHYAFQTKAIRLREIMRRYVRERRNVTPSLYYSAQIAECLTEITRTL